MCNIPCIVWWKREMFWLKRWFVEKTQPVSRRWCHVMGDTIFGKEKKIFLCVALRFDKTRGWAHIVMMLWLIRFCVNRFEVRSITVCVFFPRKNLIIFFLVDLRKSDYVYVCCVARAPNRFFERNTITLLVCVVISMQCMYSLRADASQYDIIAITFPHSTNSPT